MWSTGDRGFTLVELVVVIVVVAVLATAIVPRLSAGTGSARLRSAASRLLTAARYARDFAVTRRCVCRLGIDSDEGRYGLAYRAGPAEEFRPMRGVGGQERLSEPLRFAKVRIARRRDDGTVAEAKGVVFTPTGTADAAVVQITDGRRTISIVVAPNTARARLVDGAVDELPNDRVDLDG